MKQICKQIVVPRSEVSDWRKYSGEEERRGRYFCQTIAMKGRDKLSLEEEEQCRLIAKARIHIERWNERMKIFQFVKGPVKQQKVCLLSQAVYVCGCLANFSRELAV